MAQVMDLGISIFYEKASFLTTAPGSAIRTRGLRENGPQRFN